MSFEENVEQLEKIVQEVTLEYPVILLAGPRQVGKTTMLMKLMEGSFPIGQWDWLKDADTALEYKNKIIVIGNEANGVSKEIKKIAKSIKE